MKKILFLILLLLGTRLTFAQSFVNPDTIHQRGDIYIQNTDVYYIPMAPDTTDTRSALCNEAGMLLDSDAIYPHYPSYTPMPHGIPIYNWAPCYDSVHHRPDTLGTFAVWQRLFQALDKPDGTHSDIIVGSHVTTGTDTGKVTISANEDVDFRATGTIKMENGFHVRAGAFFHAYQEPKWDTAVFSDEFDDTAKFDSLWHVSNGRGGNNYPEGAECLFNTNVRLVTDPDAHDGHAVDIMIQEDTVDTAHSLMLGGAYLDNCGNIASGDTTPQKFIFSTGMIRSCPFPFTQKVDTPLASAYAHAPYGKYEIREKIPHVMHHTNNWGGGQNYGFEYDLNETDWTGNMGIIQPDFNHKLWRGPFKGIFSRVHDTVIFISSAAEWCPSNNPESLVIDNVPYPVERAPRHGWDTLCAAIQDGHYLPYPDWPALLANSTDSFSFYYSIVSNCFADTLPWNVTQASDSTWRIFKAAYHDSAGHLLRFSKWNQPTSVTLTIDHVPNQKTFNCHWEYNLNPPAGTGDSGILYLDQPMDSSDLHSGREAYAFRATDLYSSPGYPMPPVPFNGNDTTGHYEYHTFAMEWLPHEVRILVDSVVVARLPDRLVPPGTPYSDWITTLPRTLANILPAETDIDPPSNAQPDRFGADDTSFVWEGNRYYNSITGEERLYFEHAASVSGWPGFETIDGKPVAHHEIDYVKVWDVPKDVLIPNLPY